MVKCGQCPWSNCERPRRCLGLGPIVKLHQQLGALANGTGEPAKGNSGANCGKIIGKPWENHRKIQRPMAFGCHFWVKPRSAFECAWIGTFFFRARTSQVKAVEIPLVSNWCLGNRWYSYSYSTHLKARSESTKSCEILRNAGRVQRGWTVHFAGSFIQVSVGILSDTILGPDVNVGLDSPHEY